MSFRPKPQVKEGKLTMSEVKLMLQAREEESRNPQKLTDEDMAREMEKRGYLVQK